MMLIPETVFLGFHHIHNVTRVLQYRTHIVLHQFADGGRNSNDDSARDSGAGSTGKSAARRLNDSGWSRSRLTSPNPGTARVRRRPGQYAVEGMTR